MHDLDLIEKIDRSFTLFGSVNLKAILNGLKNNNLLSIMVFKTRRRNFETNELFRTPLFRALAIKYRLFRHIPGFLRHFRR
ncbi:MAG: hypothetical protein QXU92_02600 [Candidatus Diapherotrites archaeon]